LRANQIPFALIGATALAVHGVSRATGDRDVLVVDRVCLSPSTWASLRQRDVVATIRVGQADDPLAGVVRLTAANESPVDLVVGREPWQARALDRTISTVVDGVAMPVVSPVDLVMLKLYAGGPQDGWDILQLLDAGDRPSLTAQVEAAIGELPDDARRLWARVVNSR